MRLNYMLYMYSMYVSMYFNCEISQTENLIVVADDCLAVPSVINFFQLQNHVAQASITR